MTLQGGEEFLGSFFDELLTERETLGQILTSFSADRLQGMQKTFVPPVALVQLDIEGGTQLGIPSSLLDAVEHDDTSAALRCWLGHCYAAHRLRSPDAAHAYMQVIRNDYAVHKTYTPTAEVGLAWSHVHNVSCSFFQLWQTSLSHMAPDGRTVQRPQGEVIERVQSSCGSSRGLDARVVAALLDFQSTGVIDTSALLSVPQPLTQFCHDAVVHHTLAVEDYRREKSSSEAAAPSPASLQPSPLFAHRSATTGAARHLRLAEEGFQRALRADPANIGALCGLGRLRCLSVCPHSSAYTSDDAFNSGLTATLTSTSFSSLSPSVDYNGAGASPSTQAIQFFCAALNNARAPSHVLAAGRCASPENCAHAMDDVWLSYAAYWLAEELKRAHVEGTAQRTAPLHVSPSSASQEWLERSLRYYPRNDWALTSLGLSYLHGVTRASGQLSNPTQNSESKKHQRLHHHDDRRRGVEGEVDVLRGLTLLQRALAINPTNMWTLWGIGTYGRCAAQRDRCQHLLRSLVVKGIPKLH